MNKKFIMQQNEKDCAVACLYNIIKYHKGNIDIDKLRNMLNTNKKGTSVYDIVKTSNELGLNTNAYKCEINDLCSQTFPLIAHIKLDEKYDHYIIIRKIKDYDVYIFDPIRGYLKYDIEVFCNEWTNIIITFEKTKEIINEKGNIKNISYYILKNKKIITIFLSLTIIYSILSILNSFYLSLLYNNPFLSNKIFIIFILISILKFILDCIRNNIILNYTIKFDKKLMNTTYNKILSLPIQYHHNRPVGDIVSRINDLSCIKEFITTISFSLIIDILYIILISIILLVINNMLFILLSIFSIIYVITYILYREKIYKLSLKTKEKSSYTNTLLVDSLFGIDTIKNIKLENIFINKFNNKYNDLLKSNYNFNKSVINSEIILEFISNISNIVLIFISILFYQNNIISFSNVLTLNLLIFYFYTSLKNIISFDHTLIETKNSYKRLSEFLKYNNSYKNPYKNLNINQIKFNKLNFSYNNSNKVINDINFIINKNDYVFIKGQSGIGKSTIFKLLLKQLKCDDDMIRINDIDINNINQEDILNEICYVSQNEYIFTDTILNNIKMYKNYKEEEINKVMKITGLDKVLSKRNISLNYLLEENGHNLSGGERQRILLSRSLLQNKKFLILDETMNELDVLSERKIINEIKNNYNITLILISHRDNNSNLFNKVIKI